MPGKQSREDDLGMSGRQGAPAHDSPAMCLQPVYLVEDEERLEGRPMSREILGHSNNRGVGRRNLIKAAAVMAGAAALAPTSAVALESEDDCATTWNIRPGVSIPIQRGVAMPDNDRYDPGA